MSLPDLSLWSTIKSQTQTETIFGWCGWQKGLNAANILCVQYCTLQIVQFSDTQSNTSKNECIRFVEPTRTKKHNEISSFLPDLFKKNSCTV